MNKRSASPKNLSLSFLNISFLNKILFNNNFLHTIWLNNRFLNTSFLTTSFSNNRFLSVVLSRTGLYSSALPRHARVVLHSSAEDSSFFRAHCEGKAMQGVREVVLLYQEGVFGRFAL